MALPHSDGQDPAETAARVLTELVSAGSRIALAMAGTGANEPTLAARTHHPDGPTAKACSSSCRDVRRYQLR